QYRQAHPPRRLSLVCPSDSGEKRGFTAVTRTAEEPAQTVNVEQCFVPATHTPGDAKLPSVSGSSGRLVVERPRDDRPEPSYPGQVFAEAQHPYAEAMQAFVAASSATTRVATDGPAAAPSRKTVQTTLRHQAAALRAHRRALRQQRREEDA